MEVGAWREGGEKGRGWDEGEAAAVGGLGWIGLVDGGGI